MRRMRSTTIATYFHSSWICEQNTGENTSLTRLSDGERRWSWVYQFGFLARFRYVGQSFNVLGVLHELVDSQRHVLNVFVESVRVLRLALDDNVGEAFRRSRQRRFGAGDTRVNEPGSAATVADLHIKHFDFAELAAEAAFRSGFAAFGEDLRRKVAQRNEAEQTRRSDYECRLDLPQRASDRPDLACPLAATWAINTGRRSALLDWAARFFDLNTHEYLCEKPQHFYLSHFSRNLWKEKRGGHDAQVTRKNYRREKLKVLT